jgi:hypothetical protein
MTGADDKTAPADPTECRRKCGGSMRPMCYASNACRLAVIPLVWWGIFGFGGGPSGTQWLRSVLGLGTVGAAAAMALLLALVSAATLMPCRIHRRILRRRAACGACSAAR